MDQTNVMIKATIARVPTTIPAMIPAPGPLEEDEDWDWGVKVVDGWDRDSEVEIDKDGNWDRRIEVVEDKD